MNAKEISLEEWKLKYDQREFNTPKLESKDAKLSFEKEFDNVSEGFEQFLKSEYPETPPEEDFAVYVQPYHNWTRVLSAEVTAPTAFSRQNVLRLQQHLSKNSNEWMAILDCWGATLFVTPTEVSAFIPIRDDWAEIDISWIKPKD